MWLRCGELHIPGVTSRRSRGGWGSRFSALPGLPSRRTYYVLEIDVCVDNQGMDPHSTQSAEASCMDNGTLGPRAGRQRPRQIRNLSVRVRNTTPSEHLGSGGKIDGDSAINVLILEHRPTEPLMEAHLYQTKTPYGLGGKPNKQPLLNEFRGRDITTLRTPAVVIDRALFKRNCTRMHENAKQWGASFRAHVKTHKVGVIL